MPEVAVLLPAARADRYLEQALSSILLQRDVDLEILLLLDGVPEDQVLPYLLEDRRVRLSGTDGSIGVAQTLNRGIGLSDSEFVARMDADDLAMPNRLGAQLGFLRANSRVGVLGTGAILIDHQGDGIGIRRPSASPWAVRRSLLLRNQLIHPSVMMRRSVLHASGGYNPELVRVEDYDLWLRMATFTDVCSLREPLLKYRVHPDQWTRQAPIAAAEHEALLSSKRHLARTCNYPAVVADALDSAATLAKGVTSLYRAVHPG